MLFFFFKQKTAYEMRISDWSSDVCSSDLEGDPPRWKELDIDHSAGISLRRRPKPNRRPRNLANLAKARSRAPMGWPPGLWARVQYIQTIRAAKTTHGVQPAMTESMRPWRSEARRGGKECVSTCVYRWSPA